MVKKTTQVKITNNCHSPDGNCISHLVCNLNDKCSYVPEEKVARRKKIKLELTPAQLEDLINCVEFAIREEAAYGHCTSSEQALLEFNRERLQAKLEKARGE